VFDVNFSTSATNRKITCYSGAYNLGDIGSILNPKTSNTTPTHYKEDKLLFKEIHQGKPKI
jgi:hypothetical protein